MQHAVQQSGSEKASRLPARLFHTMLADRVGTRRPCRNALHSRSCGRRKARYRRREAGGEQHRRRQHAVPRQAVPPRKVACPPDDSTALFASGPAVMAEVCLAALEGERSLLLVYNEGFADMLITAAE